MNFYSQKSLKKGFCANELIYKNIVPTTAKFYKIVHIPPFNAKFFLEIFNSIIHLYYIWHTSVPPKYQSEPILTGDLTTKPTTMGESSGSQRDPLLVLSVGKGGWSATDGLPRATRGWFFGNSPNRIFGPRNAEFYTEKKILPGATADRFFTISSNRIFGSQKSFFAL